MIDAMAFPLSSRNVAPSALIVACRISRPFALNGLGSICGASRLVCDRSLRLCRRSCEALIRPDPPCFALREKANGIEVFELKASIPPRLAARAVRCHA